MSSSWLPVSAIAPGLHDDDPVRVAHRREAVRDDEGGAAAHQARMAPLDEALGFRIERARRLVEEQDRRVLEEGAGERDALALAAGEPAAAGARPWRRSPPAERAMKSCAAAAFAAATISVLGGAGAAEGDIRPDRVVEQDHVLAHHGDLARAGSASVTSRTSWPSIGRRPPVDVVEARHEREQRRLARSRAADERRRPARRRDEVDAVERRDVLAVAEATCSKRTSPPATASARRARPRGDPRPLVHDREGALERGRRLLHDGVEVAERADRLRGEDQGARRSR